MAGALGLELAEGWVDASTADRNGLMVVLITTEEAMGRSGVLLMLSTVLASLHFRLPVVLVNLGFDHGRLIRWKGTTVLSFTRQSDSLSLGSAARSACESCDLAQKKALIRIPIGSVLCSPCSEAIRSKGLAGLRSREGKSTELSGVHPPTRAYYDKKRAQGMASRTAFRATKRQVCKLVYRTLCIALT